MKLEVGKFYLCASGEVVKITYFDEHYFCSDGGTEYSSDGKYLINDHYNDLIAEIPKELHQYLIQTIKDYHTDLDFKATVDNVLSHS